jgi:hypothetical protein
MQRGRLIVTTESITPFDGEHFACVHAYLDSFFESRALMSMSERHPSTSLRAGARASEEKEQERPVRYRTAGNGHATALACARLFAEASMSVLPPDTVSRPVVPPTSATGLTTSGDGASCARAGGALALGSFRRPGRGEAAKRGGTAVWRLVGGLECSLLPPLPLAGERNMKEEASR